MPLVCKGTKKIKKNLKNWYWEKIANNQPGENVIRI